MKKLMVCLLAITFAMSLTAFAQQDNNNMSQTQTDQMAPKAPLMTLKGTVKMEGDKTVFVNDKDGKSLGCDESRGVEGSRRTSRAAQRARLCRQEFDPRHEREDAQGRIDEQ